MDTLILDPRQSQRLLAERQARGLDRFDEVWKGVYVMAPAPNDEHQEVMTRLARPFLETVEDAKLGAVRICINLAAEPEDWEHDYRVPDVAVFLNDSRAICHGAFWSGPPDFVVEIVSPFDKTREKLSFYSELGTRELLIVDRDPWQLELYRLQGASLQVVAKAALNQPAITSQVLPLAFRLVQGKSRPTIEVVTTDTQKSWTI